MISTQISCTHLPEHMGRLPEPVGVQPISGPRMTALSEFWKKMGVSLWLYDDKCICSFPREKVQPFWQHILNSAEAELKEFASGTTTAPEHSDWRGAFILIRIPVMQKRRRIGTLLGIVVRDADGEAFTRCCGAWKLDRKAMLSMASALAAPGPLSAQSLMELIERDVQHAIELDLQTHSIASLTQNLENTYEELGLIYRISREMSVPQNQADSLKRIGAEILQICRAQSLVFILDPSLGQAVTGGDDPSRWLVHCSGDDARHAEYQRLCDVFDRVMSKSDHHMVCNDVSGRTEFAWASPWLNHVVALPIKQAERRLAMMMALNCRDGGDFTSIDVQLLRTVADRVASFLDNQRLYHDLAGLFMGLLHSLINSVDAKDPYTCGHSERVAHFSRLLAQAVGLQTSQCERVYLAGLLHDVGKIGIPDAILSKPGKLTDEEFTVLKQHPQIGAYIVDHVRTIHDLIPAVLHHHERIDGRGYPRGLAGDEIPLLGRIVCLADCFDAMTTNRTYRAAMPVQSAIAEIRRCSGTQFDPRLAELFLELDLHAVFDDARKISGTGGSVANRSALQMTLSSAMLTSIGNLPARVTQRATRDDPCQQA
jgi:HD-GYP domain-containing protein (c-di-GMP phosphodiesterase class II)